MLQALFNRTQLPFQDVFRDQIKQKMSKCKPGKIGSLIIIICDWEGQTERSPCVSLYVCKILNAIFI